MLVEEKKSQLDHAYPDSDKIDTLDIELQNQAKQLWFFHQALEFDDIPEEIEED